MAAKYTPAMQALRDECQRCFDRWQALCKQKQHLELLVYQPGGNHTQKYRDYKRADKTAYDAYVCLMDARLAIVYLERAERGEQSL